jgi:uncharacterized protein (TIGR02453 family)
VPTHRPGEQAEPPLRFPRATLDFLTDLRANNSREWFDANRARYERDLVGPAKAFVTAAAPLLDRLAPGIAADPRVLGSIFRINRDTRFAPDKRPYKDHLDLWFWHGRRAEAASGLFLRLTPDELSVGAGAHDLQKERLQRYREAVTDPTAGPALAGIVAGLDAAGIGVAGRSLKRPPTGFAAVPEAAPLLLHRALFSATTEPSEVATADDLAGRLERLWGLLAPLHLWLVEHVQDDPGR